MVHLTNQLIIKMKQQKNIARILALSIICATILTIGIVSGMFAGESTTITLDEEFDYWSIAGNESPVEIIVRQDGLNAIVTIGKYVKNETFSLIFFNKEKETITQTVYTGGGGSSSRTKYIDRNITKNIPIYTDRVEEIDKLIEVPIETIVEVETGYEWWHVLMAFIFAVIVSMIIIHFYLEGGVKNGVSIQ